MRKPRVKIISSKELKKRCGLKQGGYTVGNTVYHTRKAGGFVVEHEKAHVKLRHKPAKLNRYQFIKRELKADKVATKETGRKYRKRDLEDIVVDASSRFEMPKRDARVIVIKEARKLRLI
jgi:hypothetical protein